MCQGGGTSTKSHLAHVIVYLELGFLAYYYWNDFFKHAFWTIFSIPVLMLSVLSVWDLTKIYWTKIDLTKNEKMKMKI